jgi:hypothetical protein
MGFPMLIVLGAASLVLIFLIPISIKRTRLLHEATHAQAIRVQGVTAATTLNVDDPPGDVFQQIRLIVKN